MDSISIWTKDALRLNCGALEGSINTDAAVIGGGIAGLLTAYELTRRGVDCIVLEQNEICGGVTKNTTAKITSQHGLIYDKLIRTKGGEAAGQYLEANENAVRAYTELCSGIDCDFELKDAYVYTTSDRRKIEDEVQAVIDLGGDAEFTENIELPVSSLGAVRFKNQAQFNPLKFLKYIAEGLKIYEHTKVSGVAGNTVITGNGEVHCKKIIVTTHFPFINRHGLYFMKMYQQRSYVLALENAAVPNGMYIDESPGGFSLRGQEKLLLFGGGGGRTGKPCGGYERLEKAYPQLYPNAAAVQRWATQDCMTLDGVPYIGVYSKSTPDMLVATGFNKWGMTSAMVAAQLLADLVSGRKNEFELLFAPDRFSLNKQFLVNSVQSVAGLFSLKTKRCSHLGCALSYNRQEHTWDCACHGSRFDENGAVINNPAKKDIDIKQTV